MGPRLFVVCLLLGGFAWPLGPQDPIAPAVPRVENPSPEPTTGEQSAESKKITEAAASREQQTNRSANQTDKDDAADKGKVRLVKPKPKPLDEWGTKALEVIAEQVSAAGRMHQHDRASIVFLAGRALTTYSGDPATSMMQQAWSAVRQYKSSERPGLKMLQSEIILGLSQADPDYLRKNLPNEAELRDAALAATTKELARRKRFEDAIEDAGKISAEPELSSAYRTLIALMPKDDQFKVDQVFSAALTQLKRMHDRKRTSSSQADFSYLIYTAMEHVSHPLLLDACDEMIKRGASSEKRFAILTDTKSFDVSLSQLRLFYLLPVLEKIDPSRAESVRRHEKEINELLERYPRGIAELDPKYAEHPFYSRVRELAPGSRIVRSESTENAARNPLAMSVGEMRNVQDPNLAIQLLNSYATRSDDHPAMILDLLRSIADEIRYNEKVNARDYINAARTAVALPDGKDVAKDLLKKATRSIQGGLYADDNNAADLNLALKAYWPSMMAWQDVLLVANKVSPEFAWELARDINDAEIAAMCKVQLSALWLNTVPYRGFSPLRAKRGQTLAVAAP